MQGLVTLDFGNSNPHAALFHKINNKWELIKVSPLADLPIYLDQLDMNAANTSIALCEVRPRETELQSLIEAGFLVTRLREYWRGEKFAGMPVHYANSLGEDRLITAFYAYKLNKTPTLLIDAGTYVTMDVIDGHGFRGGYIIPGQQIYFSSFQHGQQLKEIPLELSSVSELPSETNQAMSQSYLAFVALAKKLVNDYQIQKIMISGGQMRQWEEFFDQKPEAPVVEGHPHLLHWALQYWFTTQIEPL